MRGAKSSQQMTLSLFGMTSMGSTSCILFRRYQGSPPAYARLIRNERSNEVRSGYRKLVQETKTLAGKTGRHVWPDSQSGKSAKVP